ncbi:MAG: methyltransferase domain-containing protein [Candidatus Aminicenantes bacterium]|nr:methyltransferase domain-containing protein [Candidatus Aminicenantes bacterium]
MPDIEIGQKYGVTYKYIEKLITREKGVNISSLRASKGIKHLHPQDFKEEQTTVWSFKQRGNWATHSGEYRGNWSPYIPRNIILKYSNPGEVVLDYFCGAGTTAIECKLLKRQCIALDINDKAIELAKQKLDLNISSEQLNLIADPTKTFAYEPKLLVGDARDLSFLQDNSIDLICSHPPYADIIHYTDNKSGDLSLLGLEEFLKEMEKVARESYRILKPGKKCAILIGDMRKNRHVVPLGFKLIDVYLRAGFKLKELIIKRQHNCKTTGFWYANSIRYNFLLLAHEYLPVFEKSELSDKIKEKGASYASHEIVSKYTKPKQERGIRELETTTVWIFPKEKFEKLLDTNIILRYKTKKGIQIVKLFSGENDLNSLNQKIKCKQNSLLYIKAVPNCIKSAEFDENQFLAKLQNEIDNQLMYMTEEGTIAILTQDVRKNNYLVPMAKIILDRIKIDRANLKEIVIVTSNDNSSHSYVKQGEFLKITHYYLLIYQIK